MVDVTKHLKTPDECLDLEKRVRDTNPNLAQRARRRAIELRAQEYGVKNDVERELLKAIYAYEEVLSHKNNRKTYASRTWQMINKYGLIHAAEKAVDRKVDPDGYKLLSEMGMSDLTFEAVILRYPSYFRVDAVDRAKERLKKLSNEND